MLFRSVFKAIDTPEFALGLRTIEGATVGLNRLMEACAVWFATAPWEESKTWCHDRVEWLYQNFGVGWEEVFFAKRKSGIMGDLLIDDRAGNIFDFLHFEPGRTAILFKQPWNLHAIQAMEKRGNPYKDRLLIADGWDDVIDAVVELYPVTSKVLRSRE